MFSISKAKFHIALKTAHCVQPTVKRIADFQVNFPVSDVEGISVLHAMCNTVEGKVL